MRIIIYLALCLLSMSVFAKPYAVVTETSIANDNWYPLSVTEMKAAAVDTALAVLTQNGDFEIVEHTRSKNSGALKFDISLIGPAKVVKLTVTLMLPDKATYVSTVSMDIHNLDYQGIYKAFEYVGRDAAKRLNVKIAMLQKKQNAQQKEILNGEVLDIYNHAQNLKREEKFHGARVLFEKIVSTSTSKDEKLIAMAEDELRYGLPIFEADNLLIGNSMKGLAVIKDNMEDVTHLYRQILADNLDNPQRIVEMNRRLDSLLISRKALSNAMSASVLSKANFLRVILQQYYMEMGEWPDKSVMNEQIKRSVPEYQVISHQSTGGTMVTIVADSKYDAQIEINGNEYGDVTINLN